MDATYRRETSLKGHKLDVLKSGLQKYIRRGDEEGALYCAGELDCFSDLGSVGERIRTNMIHRLMIIFIEDVGLAGFHLYKHVVAPLVRTWIEDRNQ
jgi:replication-associated recombination protein RarA